ncbi:unnamed protein product [Rotaria magnacalcarata]|uniref:Uncharacterized protein n=1 Tax=Rotaria magnacalcarata TaxID=392030 RepID=A0A816B4F0_9BILA|nr:unnamed protein product [Rotaria magnacalcarata]CAF4756901.1 unnamed protein product [Rotaria magnacalcarata]CAF4835296.1 unnamed protein product [Rotaria magnacalcarata]
MRQDFVGFLVGSDSPFIDVVLVSYTDYRIDFISILKIHFDLVCHRIRPDQVVFLKLQDDHNAPCQIQLFISYFRIEKFTRLRSLTLTLDISDSGMQIFLNLAKLSSLESLSLISYEINGFYFARRYDNGIDATQQDNTRLLLISDTIPISRLRHFTIDECDKKIFKNNFQRRSTTSITQNSAN